MTEYLLEQGDTYAAIKSSLVAGDIVNGQGNTFAEWDARVKAGSAGNQITYKNGTIDGVAVTEHGMRLDNSSYTTIQDFVITQVITRIMNLQNSSNVILRDLSILDSASAVYGLYMSALTDLSIYNVQQDTGGYTGATLVNCGGIAEEIKFTNSHNGLFVSGGEMYLKNVSLKNMSNDAFAITGSTFCDVKDLIVTLAGGSNGITLNGGSNSKINKFNISGVSDNDGVFATSSSDGNTLTDGIVSGIGGDGIAFYASANNEVHRTQIKNCGTAGPSTTGDAITSHGGCTGQKFHFNFSSDNLNTSHAHTLDSSGEIYHHTGINDGGLCTPTRSMLWFNGPGVWTAKNNIFYHQSEYLMGILPETHNVTTGNNCYISPISPNASPFEINTVGSTWATWVAAVGETDSVYIHINGNRYDMYTAAAPTVIAKSLYYCPVYTNGQLRAEPDNPLIGAAETLAGVNTGNITDCSGKKLWGSPDIGCFGAQPDSAGRGSALLIGAM